MLDFPDGEVVPAPLDFIDIFAGQSRESFDDADLRNLAESIKQNGQLQPGLAWLDEGRGRLLLIAGERRLRALKFAGLPTMAVKVLRGTLTQSQLLEMNITENLQRASLNPVERGKSFQRMMQLEGITAREVASRLKVSDAMVSRDLAILDLPPEMQQQVASGGLPSSVAATLARLDDDESRRYLADQFGSGKLSREGVTAAVNKQLHKGTRQKAARVAGKLEGVSFSFAFAAGQLTPDALLKAIDAIRGRVKEFQKGEAKDVAALADLLAS